MLVRHRKRSGFLMEGLGVRSRPGSAGLVASSPLHQPWERRFAHVAVVGSLCSARAVVPAGRTTAEATDRTAVVVNRPIAAAIVKVPGRFVRNSVH